MPKTELLNMDPAFPVEAILVGDRVREELEDEKHPLSELENSIRKSGLIHPLGIGPDNRLITGRRRLYVIKEVLGWNTVPVCVIQTLDDHLTLLRMERDENTCRKPLTPSEKAKMASLIEREEAERAAKRRGKRNLDKKEKGQTRDKIASAVGTSGKTLDKIKKVVKAAEDDPRLSPIKEEMDKTGKVDGAYKKVLETQNSKTQEERDFDDIMKSLGKIKFHLHNIKGEHRQWEDVGKGMDRHLQTKVWRELKNLIRHMTDLSEGFV